MSKLSAHVRLRPVRLAFIVRPDDKRRVLEIFRINTCLWGGKFNPIVPFFKRIPNWWDRDGHRFDSAKQIINGYLDRFEPDFLVEAERGLADGLGFNAKRIFQLAEVLPRADQRDRKGIGQSTFDLYKHLYQTDFQFERRHKHNIISVTAADPVFDAYCACVFGGFPEQKNQTYLARAFKDAFDPAEITLNGASFLKLYKSHFTSALKVGHSKIKVDYYDHSNPTLFVLDALKARDLIDFWNLRAFQQEIIAVPIQWLDQLSEFCRGLIKKAHRPLPDNKHGVMLHATVMFSRSIPQADIDALHKQHLFVMKKGANVLQTWYPSIWRSKPSQYGQSSRPQLEAGEKSIDVEWSEDRMDAHFDSIHPEFAERFGNENRWANVIRLTDWSFNNQIATVLPTEYRDPKFSPFRVGGDVFLSTTEGFVQFPKYRDIPHYWKLRDGIGVIGDWLKTSNIDARLSDAGRATQQIIQTLGGFGGVRSIAHAGIVKLLNEISRRPTLKSMQHQEFMNKINAAVKGDAWREDAAEVLVKKNAVEVGLEVRCTKCGSWSWYSLKQMDYKLNCSLCLREFGFPIIDPSNKDNSRWAYRLIGPFALPDYASGGYAAALSIRFFSTIIGDKFDSGVTWSSGQELTFPNGKKVEADFILWYRRMQTFNNYRATEIVIGEAKSFGREGSMGKGDAARKMNYKDTFAEEDVSRMKLLAEAFPGATIVFATMKEAKEMSVDELARIRRLAEWGRDYSRESRRSRAPVILLTGTELFTGYALHSEWEAKGGKHKELVSHGFIRPENLRTLADLTQQIYLDMPPYHKWLEAKWKARREQRERRAKKTA